MSFKEDVSSREPDLSVVIPAHNEEGCVAATLATLAAKLRAEKIAFELVVVNDHSQDDTAKILKRLKKELPELVAVDNTYPGGFGFAIRKGLDEFRGRYVAIFMADASDSPDDVVGYFRLAQKSGADCVFGSRFIKGSRVYDYPMIKLILNRMANTFIRVIFGLGFNDTTNAFKLYKGEVIRGLQPLLSHHFNLTVELPLKAITRGYTFTTMPISWTNRKTGVSKLKIREMGSRYVFIVLYCLIEKWLSCGDYRIK